MLTNVNMTCINFEIAQCHYNMQNYEQAIDFYYKYIEYHECKLFDAHLGIALCMQKMENYFEAIECYEKCIECVNLTNSDLILTYYSIGICHESSNDYINAIKFYLKCKEIDDMCECDHYINIVNNDPDLVFMILLSFESKNDTINNEIKKLHKKSYKTRYLYSDYLLNNIGDCIICLEENTQLLSIACDHKYCLVCIIALNKKPCQMCNLCCI